VTSGTEFLFATSYDPPITPKQLQHTTEELMMRALILACGIWFVAFAAVVLGLISMEPSTSELIGQVVYDNRPFCQSFVVQSDRGFAILDGEDANLVFGETDTVVGPLRTRGLQSFDVVGRGIIEARLYVWTPNRLHAEQAFRDRCGLDRGMPIGAAFMP
jgi:hypothetical protein